MVLVTGTDRRKSPRTPYPATALVYVGNEQYTCRVADLSKDGLQIYPPVRQGVGTFLRLNIPLPALDKVLDVDGFVVRENEKDGEYSWGVQLHEPSPRATALIEAYVNWDRAQEPGAEAPRRLKAESAQWAPVSALSNGEAKPEDPGPPVPPSEPEEPPDATCEESEPSFDERPTQTHTRVEAPVEEGQSVTSQFRAAAIKQRKDDDERWAERQEKAKAEKELRDLYAEALKNTDTSLTATGTARRPCSGNWVSPKT